MIIKNKLDKTFGPFGSSTGFFLIPGGIAATWFSIFGLVLVILGAFIAFTSSGVQIDTEEKKVRFCDNLFGIFPAGKWIDIRPDMKLGLKKSHKGYVGYIRGTQPVGIHYNDVRIFLYDSSGKPLIPLKKSGSAESLRKDAEEYCSILGLQFMM